MHIYSAPGRNPHPQINDYIHTYIFVQFFERRWHLGIEHGVPAVDDERRLRLPAGAPRPSQTGLQKEEADIAASVAVSPRHGQYG